MPYVEYDEVQASCSDCGRMFPSEEALAEHRRETHGTPGTEDRPTVRSVECSVCHARLRSTAALTEHNRRAHTG